MGEKELDWKAMWEEERRRADKAERRADKEKQRADILQDTLIRQGGTGDSNIPLTTYSLIHKPGTSPCVQTSTARAEGMFCICSVKEHWHMDEVGTIMVEQAE